MIFPELPTGGWQIKKAASYSGRDLIEDWLKKLQPGQQKFVRIELDTMLRFLRNLDAKFWGRPQFDWLQGERYAGLGEIILDCQGIPFRPIGCFGPEVNQFTLLIGARKDRKRRGLVQWDPINALDTAADRRDAILRRELSVHDYNF